MAQPYIGDIEVFGFNFAPVGWLPCDGRTVPISQYTALYNLLGTTYGGDGQNTFGLPDLRGRAAINAGQGPGLSNYQFGQSAGVESVTLTVNQMPAHNHPVFGVTTNATTNNPTNNVWAVEPSGATSIYETAPDSTRMSAAAITPDGGSQPHENRSPILAMNYCIATDGIYPTQS